MSPWNERGWGWGLGGFAIGALAGAAIARSTWGYPGYYGYGYPAYGYGYGYPAYGYGYGYPVAYGYGYGPAYSYGYPAYYGGYYRPYYGAYAAGPRVARAASAISSVIISRGQPTLPSSFTPISAKV